MHADPVFTDDRQELADHPLQPQHHAHGGPDGRDQQAPGNQDAHRGDHRAGRRSCRHAKIAVIQINNMEAVPKIGSSTKNPRSENASPKLMM